MLQLLGYANLFPSTGAKDDAGRIAEEILVGGDAVGQLRQAATEVAVDAKARGAALVGAIKLLTYR